VRLLNACTRNGIREAMESANSSSTCMVGSVNQSHDFHITNTDCSPGLHPEEAVQYLTSCLLDHSSSSKPVYAICGTGHHSKNGKDKVGKAVRQHLNEWRYAFREFSVPGDRNNVGGILGVDPSSFDRDAAKRMQEAGPSSEADSGVGFLSSSAEDTKLRILRREE
jgi:hypothetical protein